MHPYGVPFKKKTPLHFVTHTQNCMKVMQKCEASKID